MSFGKRLADARKDAGLTQQELGKGLSTDGADASKSVVYGWEKDQHYPRVDQLVLICRRLNCSADYLLFGEAAPTHLTPKVRAAQKVVGALSDEERLALLAAIQQPALPDSEVERRIPATRQPKPLPMSSEDAEAIYKQNSRKVDTKKPTRKTNG